MQNYWVSLSRETDPDRVEEDSETICEAIWVERGRAEIDGLPLRHGEGCFIKGTPDIINADGNAGIMRFAIRNAPLTETAAVLGQEQIEVPAGPALIRLDQVTFPPGAVAYRHIHPGPGFRYLSTGKLEVTSDTETHQMTAGKCWFEPANSPVRAVASTEHAMTRFIRLMVLPVAYEGIATINILDPKDAQKPRLQVTHRIFDQFVNLDQSG